ncbi:VOC family protein [Litoribrevibacter albus]|nr:VOC family protein [Litoribrevibacter albus]
MSSSHYKPNHVPQLTPCLTVEEPEKSINFYELAFGFETIGNPIVKEGLVIFAEMFCLEARIMIQRQGSFSSISQTPKQIGTQQGIGIYLYIPDIESHFERAQSCGATILSELIDTFWGDQIYTAKDLDGYLWTFAQKISDPNAIDEDIAFTDMWPQEVLIQDE